MNNSKLIYIEKAKEFIKEANEEFERAKQKASDVLFRNAAEKAWNAVVLATNYVIEKELRKKVRGNRQRREALEQLELKNGRIAKLKIYDRFMARCHYLHENCFYDGIYTQEGLELNIKKAYEYIKDIEKIE